jgi:hypothetical protein
VKKIDDPIFLCRKRERIPRLFLGLSCGDLDGEKKSYFKRLKWFWRIQDVFYVQPNHHKISVEKEVFYVVWNYRSS